MNHPTNLDFHEMSLSDWIRALPEGHKAKTEVRKIILTIQIARDYLVETGWDGCDNDDSPFCMLCSLNRILKTHENDF